MDGIAHVAAMDEVKLLGIGPLGFHVVDFKVDVRRYPGCCQ